MPTYDYICLECKHVFEHFQSMSAAPLETCPECSGKVQRKIGAGLQPIFKGTGFYQTDYKATPKPSPAPKSSVPETKTETKSSETKSETPSSPKPSTDSKKD